MKLQPLTEEEIILMQPAQARRKRLVKARFAAMRLAGRKPPRGDGLLIDEASRLARFGEKLRNFAGPFRRVISATRRIPGSRRTFKMAISGQVRLCASGWATGAILLVTIPPAAPEKHIGRPACGERGWQHGWISVVHES